MRVKLKKLTALLLSISMVLSMFTNLLPAGYAAEGGVSTHAEGTDQDYNDIVGTRQPGLYIDFLGDNRKYLPKTSSPVASGLAAPGLEDQNANTNDNIKNDEDIEYKWTGYVADEKDAAGNSLYGNINSTQDTIFWIGVGIDKMDEFDLFRQDPSGVYSLELGFYYDNRYIEPYIGAEASYSDSPEKVQEAYEEIIRQANLANYDQYKWDGYHVVSAETGLPPQTDPVTQETLEVNKSNGYAPNMNGIMNGEGGSNNWRMTYVAIERDSGRNNRSFTGDNEEGTKYLLIIPFRLKSHDPSYRTHLCLRLARNAGMFSIGGGEDGSYPYAAWERTTTRNPGRELKLMANFRGDLNIFNGERVQDELYDAGLYLDNGGGSGNTARLSVDGDPSSKKVDLEGQSLTTKYIKNLPAGTGMKVDITVQTGYQATVSVYSLSDEDKPVADRNYIIAPFVWTEATGSFTFVMPAEDVLVDVRFAITDNTIFNLYLDEYLTEDGKRPGEVPVRPSGTVLGNDTVLKAHYPGNPTPPAPATDPIPAEDVTVTKNSPVDPNLNLPREKVTIEAPKPVDTIKTSLEVEISLHKDYYAEVEIYQISTGSNIRPDNTPESWFSVSTTNNNVVTVTSDGTLTVEGLPQSDMIVRVRYLLAKRVTGILEVWHQGTEPVSDNVAQLRTAGYNDDNDSMPAYSGVVYQHDRGTPADVTDDNHRAVEGAFRVLERVEAQAALLSGSLGGDGNIPVPWAKSVPDGGIAPEPDPNSMMAVLYSATSAADFVGKINAYDLRKLTGLTGKSGKDDGLRKNSAGDYYADSEMTDFFDRLWEIRTLAAADPTLKVDVLDPNDTTKTLFSYYNLTLDQLQVYLLDYEKADTAGTVSALALRSAAEAAAELATYSWYDPTADNGTRPPSIPNPDSNGYELETRVGREMAVVLEASSVYTMLDKVLILDADTYDPVTGVGTEIANATQDPDYKNVYLFSVPNRDYVVKVVYKEREADKLNLSITIPIGDEDPGNTTKVTAFAPDPNSPAARRVVKSKYTKGVEPVADEDDRILVGSTVTVLVNKLDGYKASATVVNLADNSTVPTDPGANITNNLADGTSFTFSMPATTDRIEIRITYTRDVELHNAYLIEAGETGGGSAVWEGTTSTVKAGVPEGDALKAEITVEPGYYIVSAEAYTAANAYPFTISGNGWNNGAGGMVTLDTVMPDQEYYVRITFAKGPPPEEDLMALTLQVVDPDNDGTPYVDNYAQAQAGTVTLGPVGLVKTGPFNPPQAGTVVAPGSAEPDTKAVKAGELVTVEYEVKNGFALDSIVVEPTALGVTPNFVTGADNKVRAQFTMPSASARVIVTFRKTENIKTRLFLDLNKTENGTLATETNLGVSGNTVNWVKSDTFDKNTGLTGGKFIVGSIPATVPRRDDTSMTTGVALPGENVSFNIQVAGGWYVHSVTLTDALGSRLSYSLTDPVAGEQVASFIMPASDVTAIVNYRQGTPPDPDDPKDTDSDRLLELVVLDPDNKGSGDPVVYDDNWAKAEVSGVTAATLGELGLYRGATRSETYVKPGDQVTVEYKARTGYTLEVITVTSDGTPSTIAPIYLTPDTATAPGKATFTMPDANVSAVVRFRAVTKEKPVQEYTANLILHMPADVDPEDYDTVGEGSFIYDVYDLNNKSYSRTAFPGETIDFTAWAKDGYYIQRVSVTPAALGVSAVMSGAFGLQDGSFVMPGANVEVNVFFVKLDEKKEWPGDAAYRLALEVYDASGLDGTANFENIAGNPLEDTDKDLVHSGGRKELDSYDVGGTETFIRERDRVTVTLSPAADTYVRSISVTDSRGRSVAWSYVPGGIAFDVPPAHVTVTVHYAKRTDEIDEGRKHKVTLYIDDPVLAGDTDEAKLELTADTTRYTKVNGGVINDLFAGDVLTLTITPDIAADPFHSVASAYAVVVDIAGGQPVIIPMTGLLTTRAATAGTSQTGMPLVSAGGTVQFAMPDADAAVYVTFLHEGIPHENERTGSLMVVGPTGSGSAEMKAAEGSRLSTGTVAASGGGALFAPEGTELTVDLDVKPGYAISSIRVVDGQGNDLPYTWTDGTQKQFKLEMAPSGVQVYVELEEVDRTKDLTVQVVVNNGGGAGNTAKLRLASTAVGGGKAILRPVHALDEIFLDMEVQTGYRIASIQVVPAKFGIAPSLTEKDTKDQTTSFLMPGEDLVVYVHFESDGRTRYRATLVTEGYYNDNNRGKIHSLFSGWSDEVSPSPSTYTNGEDTVSVQAAPATATDPAEWVTVDYTWGADSSVESITVVLNDGTPVPFTQNITDMTNRKGEITFPMVEGNVVVTVKYRNDPDPVGYRAVIHVIDMDNDTEITGHSWGKLTWTDQTTGNVTALVSPGNSAEILVPAGQTVTVDANTSYPEGNGVYIWAGYVIYRQGGQMINFNFRPDDDPRKGFSGDKTAEFVMHPGVNDVYIYFTKELTPNDDDFSAVLMIDSPAVDTVSHATMTSDGDSPGAKATRVVANTAPDHGYIISSKGDTITVTVTPDAGYAVDSVLMTPLGVSDDNGDPIVPVWSAGDIYTFEMPGQNVAILVKLKTSSAGEHIATLHYASADADDTTFNMDLARAALYFDKGRTEINGGRLKVDENTQMSLDVCINNSADTNYLVLAAYVLQPNGTMVPLTPALEGTTDNKEGKDAVDGGATFSMPASDVDVYVWFTQKAPAENWRTAVLTVTDEKGTTVNSGLNSARFWSDNNSDSDPDDPDNYEKLPHFVKSYGVKNPDGTNAHGFFWVEEGETVTVKINPPETGYIFSREARISHSVSGVGDIMGLPDTSKAPEYVYTYTVGPYNSAVRAHFVASDLVQNPLDVKIIDGDNPGNGKVTNVVNVRPAGKTDLNVESTTSAGARQRVPDVREGTLISFTVIPDEIPGSDPKERYVAVARWINNTTKVSTSLPLALQPDGSYVGATFDMPGDPATLEVTFYKAWNVKLSVTHTAAVPTAGKDSVAQLAESAFNTTITAVDGTPGATTVPNATKLAASMQKLNDNVEVAGVLLKRSGRVDSQLYPGTDDVYRHTLSRSDVEIQFILAPKAETEDERTYIASVSAVNKPAGVDEPVIHVTSASRTEDIPNFSWTEAKKDDNVEVTLKVPYGYKAVVSSGDVTLDSAPVEVNGPANEGDPDVTGTATFTMPTKNVHVTVKYVKTRFTAKIVVAGNGSGTATWDTATIPAAAVQTGLDVKNLMAGDTLDFTATPDNGSRIGSIMISYGTYIPGSTSTINHPVTMPEDDVVVTVVFTKERIQGYHLDLHVSGTAGGTAILNAGTAGTLQSTPAAPNGFSRLEGVESGESVTLTAVPEDGYSVTVSYYLYSGGSLTELDSFTPDPDTGGTVTFTMPATNTCIYVTFRKGENPPPADPDDPDDPNRYLDLHVSGTGGGSASLTTGEATPRIVGSTPTNPNSVSTLKPIGTGTPVTLTVDPKPGYTATVSYYVYHNGEPKPISLATIPASGGTVNFTMPSQSTCVYVTFRAEKDKMYYLDLHVTNPAGGTATLSTDGFGALQSTPTSPKTYGQISKVETGIPVTLDVTDVGVDYTVTVSYYLHDNSTLYYKTFAIDSDSGGRATFDMPNTNTCIYVKFNGPGDDPDPDPNAHYLDLHVSNPAGGSAVLTAQNADDGNTIGSVSSTPTAPVSGLQRIQPVPEGSPVTLNVTVEPDYSVSVSYYVYNGATLGSFTSTVTSTAGGTVTFDMPAYSTCVYVTYKHIDDRDDESRRYLDLHVSNPAGGSAVLTAKSAADSSTIGSVSSTPANPVSGLQRIEPLPDGVPVGSPVTLDVGPLTDGYTVTVSYAVGSGGTLTYKTYTIDSTSGGTATFDMPARSTCIYVSFQKPTVPPEPEPEPDPDPEEYIAFVVTTGMVGINWPDNAAQDIVNQTDPTKTGGTIWRYGETGDGMLVTFTTEPGYDAIVTAERVDNGASVPVVQLGTTLVGTATLNMPGGTDVKVTINYMTVSPPSEDHKHKLTLKLVGHDGISANMGELSGGAATLTLRGQDGPAGPTTAYAGDPLYLDAGWADRYRIRRITVETGGVVTDLSWNEYLRTATSDFFMPDGDTLVTVYFNSFYKATLFVIDADRKDFLNGSAADTAGTSVTNVPDTTLEVFRAGTSMGYTTSTHTPIEDLYGDERVTTTVNIGNLPTGTKVASVIATTSAGTVNLVETATGSGIYHYDMSTATRDPDDVDVTVVLGKAEENLYIATVYKVGHDNKPGNTATITNTTTTAGLPKGTIWTGAYEDDLLRVDVNTEPGYYAVVTAKRTDGTDVPILQWTAVGPFDAQFYMPASNVDVTVTYSTTPPEATLTLKLVDHAQKAGNTGAVYNMTTAPGTLIPNLTLNGTDAVDLNPVERDSVNKVVGGTNLEVRAGVETGYSIKSITMTVPGFAPITLPVSATNTATTRMPVLTGTNKALITVEFEEGVKSPRPFDPTHSTIYNGLALGGDYPTAPTPTDPGNPDLSTNPTGEEGWLLAEPDADRATGKIKVIIPTLYDKDPDDALYDAGVDKASTEDPKPVPPVYTFYWLDDLGVSHKLVEGTDITVTDQDSLDYGDNPKGKYPDPATDDHYGYTLTLTAIPSSTSPFATYVEDGGTIFVTAKRPDENESLMTQVIIPVPNYTATLHIVDLSSSLGNVVELSVQGDPSYTPVNTDGGKIEKLHGKEKLQTDVTKGDSDVKVVSVLAIPKKGSPAYVPVDMIVDPTFTYLFDMVRDDVDIVVTLANEEDEIYTATVVKDDPSNDPGNTVAISNQTHPVLNRDTNDPKRWTLGYTGDKIQVDATAAPGYRAVVTAKRLDTDAPLTVTPAAGGGVMVVALDDGMPDSNVEIKVTFVKVEEANQSWVTLRVRMDSVNGPLPIDPANKAEGSVGGTVTLTADTNNGYTNTELLTATPVNLGVKATLADGYAIKEWYVDGALRSDLGTNVNVTISIPTPTGITNTVITVVLKETKVDDRTPRPFDPAHSVHYPNATDYAGPDGHQDGYLLADNQGNSLVEITVPNLYDGELYAAENVVYTLYAKVGGAMVKLKEGTDYDTVIPVAAVGYTHQADTTDVNDEWTGQVFTIKSLDPTGVLGEYVKNGGVIYITSTKAGETESAYTEVVIPADPYKDRGYKATLFVIDDTNGATTNHVKMQNADNSTDPAATVPWDTGDPVSPTEAGHVDKLFGGELIRTEVKPDPNVTYTVMAHTDSMGSVLLFPDPTGTDRYRKDMPTEDLDVIVHFRDEDSDIHIAAVQKRGATAVPGNKADITNTTETLGFGTIWTEAKDDHVVEVEVTTAEGYYATVTMSYYDPTDGHLEEKTLVVLGSGNPDPLKVTFKMPHADVQVVVLFEAGNRSPRPYDPKHAETYYVDEYQHNTADDVSTTHQEGWLLGENLGGGRAVVTIPTLWSEDEGLENATNAAFTFYLREKDEDGAYTNNYIRLEEDVDYTLAHYDPDYTGTDVFTEVKEDYRYHPYTSGDTAEKSFDGVKFMLLEKSGGKLEGLLDSGLSLFVSATKLGTAVPPWVEGEVTELVIPSTGLRPFDPDRENPEDETDPTYEDHWIRAENRGDYLIVTVPLLNSPNEDDPTEVDGMTHRFQLHLQVEGEDWKDDISGVVNVTNLLKIQNVRGYDHPSNVNTLYDPDWAPGSPLDYTYEEYYENEIYNDRYLKPASGWPEDGEKWHGARFIVEILTDEEIEALGLDAGDETKALANAKILREIFDNEGTMNADPEKQPHRMYITSDETETAADTLPEFRAMDYVDFEVPRYYTLAGTLESYAPEHTATFSLYRYDSGNPEEEDSYEAKPAFVHRQFRNNNGMGLWRLNYAIKSSELMGDDRLGVTYKLVIEKPGHVKRTWTEVKLTPDNLDPDEDLRFTVVEVMVEGDEPEISTVIPLFGGDVDQDGYVRLEDYIVIMGYFDGKRNWSAATDPDDPEWSKSVHNTESMAHQVDLDGDGYITVGDWAIWNDRRNYNRNYTDYQQLYLKTSGLTTTIALYQEQLELQQLLLEELPEELLGLPPEEEETLLPEEELPEEDPTVGADVPIGPPDAPGDDDPGAVDPDAPGDDDPTVGPDAPDGPPDAPGDDDPGAVDPDAPGDDDPTVGPDAPGGPLDDPIGPTPDPTVGPDAPDGPPDDPIGPTPDPTVGADDPIGPALDPPGDPDEDGETVDENKNYLETEEEETLDSEAIS